MNCSYTNCKNSYWNCKQENKEIHFFRFPLDENLCRLWIEICERPDLSNKEITILHNYRVCSEHFGDEMYMNPVQKTRLLPSAVPRKHVEFHTKYLCAGFESSDIDMESSTSTGTEIKVKEEPNSSPILQDILLQPTADVKVPIPQFPDTVPVPYQLITSQTSHVAVQTPQLFFSSAEKLKLLRAENAKLKAQLTRLKAKKWSDKDFKEMCDSYLSPQLSTLVKMQVDLADSSNNGQRYTDAAKQLCLSLYSLGPKCYTYLQTICKLPSVRALQRFNQGESTTQSGDKCDDK